MKNKAVRLPPPVYLTWQDFEAQIDHWGALETGRTKDSAKSRIDLPDICNRIDLHILSNGKGQKSALFNWILFAVKFSDGQVEDLPDDNIEEDSDEFDESDDDHDDDLENDERNQNISSDDSD
ncbi:aspartic acid-rich protein-like [Eutrema salsugineum]|uniref:aspartic acid-rich protein-like n=1 Tax=Eutrema salsugineum TaxID=72664 RepID=UPI000CECF7BF|nr:aspartic acid-rich protein-like [Eutrema salsugineum]